MDDKKKKVAVIISLCSLLLVAAVVGTITMSMRNNNANQEKTPAEAEAETATTSSKSVQVMCEPTHYKDVCVKSLSEAQNTSDPKELIKVAMKAAMKEIGISIKDSALLQEAAKDPMASKALTNCEKYLDTSIENIDRSTFKIDEVDPSSSPDDDQMIENIEDLTTWMSAAITYQETCIDEFENTTGETGEKMKKLLISSRKLTSNALAMVTELTTILTELEIGKGAGAGASAAGVVGARRLMFDADGFPNFISSTDPRRKILQAGVNPPPDAIVSQTGGGQFKTINEAIRSVPLKNKKTFVILIKAGIYKEYVLIPKKVNNVVLIGEGPTKTVITGNRNAIDGFKTSDTATLNVEGDSFTAKNIGIENTAGPLKHQAVALRVSGDKAAIYNCRMDGYQDTLYAHAERQYYKNCIIRGTIDFVFGDGRTILQDCKLVIRRPLDIQDCMVTAQGRNESNGCGAIVIQNSEITADPDFLAMKPPRKAYLGRPWKEFSRTIIMQSFIDSSIAPEGWSPWQNDLYLDTLYYAEYQNRGPGANTALRVKWKGIHKINAQIADSFTVGKYIHAPEHWIQAAGVPYVSGLMKV